MWDLDHTLFSRKARALDPKWKWRVQAFAEADGANVASETRFHKYWLAARIDAWLWTKVYWCHHVNICKKFVPSDEGFDK